MTYGAALVVWLVSWLVVLLFACLFGWLVSWLVGRLFVWIVSFCLVDWFGLLGFVWFDWCSWLVYLVWLVGWLVDRSVGISIGQLTSVLLLPNIVPVR